MDANNGDLNYSRSIVYRRFYLFGGCAEIAILCGGKVSSLKRWIEEAEAAGIEAMSRFVRQLKKDRAAVENAVEHVWSNGPVEDHINRLKTLKRQMYGRPDFELLRARVLPFPFKPTAPASSRNTGHSQKPSRPKACRSD
jgi:hypothetical protein